MSQLPSRQISSGEVRTGVIPKVEVRGGVGTGGEVRGAGAHGARVEVRVGAVQAHKLSEHEVGRHKNGGRVGHPHE